MTTASYKLQMLSSTSCTNSGFFPLACRDVAHGGENLINARNRFSYEKQTKTRQNSKDLLEPEPFRTNMTTIKPLEVLRLLDLPNQTFITFSL